MNEETAHRIIKKRILAAWIDILLFILPMTYINNPIALLIYPLNYALLPHFKGYTFGMFFMGIRIVKMPCDEKNKPKILLLLARTIYFYTIYPWENIVTRGIVRINQIGQTIKRFHTPEGWVQNEEGIKVQVDLLDKYTTSAYGRMMKNLLILANLSEETSYERLAKNSLKLTPFMDSSQNAPSSMIAWLMGHYGVITLSHKQNILTENYRKIEKIDYPYLYLHSEKRDDFGVCSIGGCFSNDKDLDVVKRAILQIPQIGNLP